MQDLTPMCANKRKVKKQGKNVRNYSLDKPNPNILESRLPSSSPRNSSSREIGIFGFILLFYADPESLQSLYHMISEIMKTA